MTNLDTDAKEVIWLDPEREDKLWFTDQDDKTSAITLSPNKMILRKCTFNENRFLIGEAETMNAENSRMVEGLLAKMKTGQTINQSMRLNFCEILCVGKVTTRTKREQQTHLIAKYSNYGFCPGDFVVMPECSSTGRFWRGLWGKEYMLVSDICEPVLYMPKELLNDKQ